MLDLLHASETVAGYTIRAWTGTATDEGVGLIALMEVSDERGLPVCRFEVYLADAVRRTGLRWPREQQAGLEALQAHAVEHARHAVLSRTLSELNGHRYDMS